MVCRLRSFRSLVWFVDAAGSVARRYTGMGGRRMIATGSAVETVSFYINGVWEQPEGRTMGNVTNPATGEIIAQTPYATAADVDRAVRSAHEAFLKWRDVPVVDRVQVLYRFKTLLDKHADDI